MNTLRGTYLLGVRESCDGHRAVHDSEDDVQSQRQHVGRLEAGGEAPCGLEGLDAAPQGLILREEVLPQQRAFDAVDDLRRGDGLAQVVCRSQPHGLEGALQRGVAGQDHDLGRRPLPQHLLHQLEAVHLAHGEVREQQLDGSVPAQPLQGLGPGGREVHSEALLCKCVPRHLANQLIIVDDENSPAHQLGPLA